MYCFIDVETSNFDPFRGSLLEIACIFTNSNLEVVGNFQTYIKPRKGEWWSDGAYKIHKLSRAFLKDKPELHVAIGDFLRFCDSFNSLDRIKFVDHSRGMFDWKFLIAKSLETDNLYEFRKYFNYKEYSSTMAIARKTHPGLSSYSLGNLCTHFDIDLVNSHTGTDDARACYEIYKKCMEIIK